jgi:hypothetical protein
MNAIRVDGLKPSSFARLTESSVERTNFQVLPILVVKFAFEVPRQKVNFIGITEWLTMIGEGKRNHPQTRKPALDSAKEQTIRQFASRQRRGEDNRLVSIGLTQRFEPSRRVKDRCIWMPVDKDLPAWVC